MTFDWFRSYHGAPTDPKWLVIARKANVPVHIVVSLVWMLFDHASKHIDRGSITGFDEETAAVFLEITDNNDHNVTPVTRVIQALRDKKIITPEGRFSAWEVRQGDESNRPMSNAERQRKFREAKKSGKNNENSNGQQPDKHKDITERNEPVTASVKLVTSNVTHNESNTSNAIETKTEKEKESSKKDSNSTNAHAQEFLGIDRMRLPVDLPDDWRTECSMEMGWPADVIGDVWVNFGSNYRNKVGSAGYRTMTEWHSAWRTWYRRENIKLTPKQQQAAVAETTPAGPQKTDEEQRRWFRSIGKQHPVYNPDGETAATA